MIEDRTSIDQGSDSLETLVDTLHDTYQRIHALTGTVADTVLHVPSGTTYLLPAAQSALRDMEDMERRHATERAAIIDALPAQIALLDASGFISVVNRAWKKFGDDNLLADENYSIGRNYLDICKNAQGPFSGNTQQIVDGIQGVLDNSLDRYTLEYPCHAPDRQRWYLLAVTPLGSRQQIGAVVMHVDITERVLAQTRADDWRGRLERLIDQARLGILVHDNFVPILANAELARMFGFDSPAEILALSDCRQLFADGEMDRINSYNDARLNGDEAPTLYRVEGNRRNGEKLVMENRAFTIQWDNRTAVCAMLTDITDQVDMENQFRQAQRLDAVGQLTGGIAHDFNNLLTVILGNSELLAERLSDEPRLRNLARMSARAAGRGADLTNQLLAFARRQPLDPRETDINRRINGMGDMLRRTIGEHIEIGLPTSAHLWHAMIDPAQLESAILNLCINARDAMPDGGRLTIDTANSYLDAEYAGRQTEVEPGPYIMVAVSDTGAGMDEPTIERAFEPFFTTKGVGKGSGLGLSMVYGFVKQSHGHVRIYSELEHGTTVKLYLPRAETSEAAEHEELTIANVQTGNERILVVEDDSLVREYVSAQLTGLGYHVVAVGDGPSALQVIQKGEAFDLLFTDVVMPGGMSGRDVADEIQKLRPTLPVLFTSGYTENAIFHHDRLDPGVQLLAKPYRREDLANKVRLVIDNARRHSEKNPG
jgi:PAS domain S-box-containing protein